MVNFPSPDEQAARPVGERGSDRFQATPDIMGDYLSSAFKGTRSHHQWGARYGRRRDEMRQRGEPTSLLHLEELAKKTVELMEKYAPASDNNLPMAMNLLRMQHNLNFAMVCEKCHGTHNYDQLEAPER